MPHQSIQSRQNHRSHEMVPAKCKRAGKCDQTVLEHVKQFVDLCCSFKTTTGQHCFWSLHQLQIETTPSDMYLNIVLMSPLCSKSPQNYFSILSNQRPNSSCLIGVSRAPRIKGTVVGTVAIEVSSFLRSGPCGSKAGPEQSCQTHAQQCEYQANPPTLKVLECIHRYIVVAKGGLFVRERKCISWITRCVWERSGSGKNMENQMVFTRHL